MGLKQCSRLKDLQRQNDSIGKLKMLMSAIKNETELQNYLKLEEEKPGVDESSVNIEKSLDSQMAYGKEFNEEEYMAANQSLLQKRSDLKLKNEALLKLADAGAFCEVLTTLSKH